MELKGQQRKTDFWQAAEKRHRQIQRRYPGRASIWAGDMNVAPTNKDAAAVGIRRRLELTAPKTAALLKDELPSQTQHERDELQQLQDRLGLVDAFEHQKDTKMGRDARAKDRYSQYGHGFRKEGLGQRVDLILTDIPMTRTGPMGPEVTQVKILTNERGSDHLPVEATFSFPAPDPSETDPIVAQRALGSPARPGVPPDTDTSRVYKLGDRVLVKREELHSVAASDQRPWIPATVKEVQGDLIRIRVDTTWLIPNRRQEQGVTLQGIKPLSPSQYPTRFVLGEEIRHFKTKKRGTVVSIQLGDGDRSDHQYGVQYTGTVDTKLSGMASLRAPLEVEPLTSAYETPEAVFRAIAADMAGITRILLRFRLMPITTAPKIPMLASNLPLPKKYIKMQP